MTQNGEQVTQEGEFLHSSKQLMPEENRTSFSYFLNVEHLQQPSDSIKKRESVIQMIYLLKGSVELVSADGSEVYARIEAFQHNLLRFSPQLCHLVADKVKNRSYCIQLSESFLQRYLPQQHPLRQQLLQNAADDGPSLLFADNMYITPPIAVILHDLADFSQSNFCSQLILQSKVIHLLALQLQQFEQLQDIGQPSLLRKDDLEKMQQVRDILLEQSGAKLSLRTLAHMVGTNEFSLKRNFKQAFGTTVYGYLNQYKMERAKSLLLENVMSIAEISAQMGYKYPTHFSAAFKKHFGYLPNELNSSKL
ncbi:AraC family transcriptional regulator [Pedobacter sp. SYSU D00535]|uniref:helix-turn-helix domain-containing protein n=1 Tax=Pedobacter sp. SYSU D00535 TaxID=2810308 RepID=UPI001A96FFAD|nr:AraC family transcriptional regulator [Pedobacter sp. SYSU D00535]